MPATTPSGCRIEYTSTPDAACSLNPPFMSSGTPHAYSTFSRPRAISPCASASTLPCSAVRIFASSSMLSCSRWRNANSTPLRLDSDAERHSALAAFALATAASTSSRPARSTSALCNPVAGLNTGPVRPEVPAVILPSIQCEMRSMATTIEAQVCTAQYAHCYVTNVTTVLSALESRLDEPSARGLATAVSRAVRDGVLAAGDRLPPIRSVATELGLSPTTVSAAWSLLARTGTIRTDGRRGTRVAERQRPGTPRYQRTLDRQTAFGLDLSTGVPDPELLPDLSRALGTLTGVATPGSYLDDPVLPELAAVLRAQWPFAVDDLTVVDGAMDGIELATRVLVGFGDRVAVESPGFPPLLDLLEASGAEVVGVPVDSAGLRADALRAAGPLTAVYLQPRAQNPTGVSLTAERAAELARVVRDGVAVVIEDDSAGAVAATEPLSLGRWVPERTVHVRSFAKSHGPDLRLAALSAPPELLDRITALRQLGQGWSSRLLQRLLLALLTDRSSVRQVERARAAYARRREALVAALAEHGVTVGGTDGLNVWVPVADETAAVVRLASQGIGVAPGAPFGVLPGQAPHVRVTAGLLASDQDRVAAAIAAAARGPVRIPV